MQIEDIIAKEPGKRAARDQKCIEFRSRGGGGGEAVISALADFCLGGQQRRMSPYCTWGVRGGHPSPEPLCPDTWAGSTTSVIDCGASLRLSPTCSTGASKAGKLGHLPELLKVRLTYTKLSTYLSLLNLALLTSVQRMSADCFPCGPDVCLS